MARRVTRRYTAEFKAEAVALAMKGSRTVVEVAAGLGVPKSTLAQWVLAAREGMGIDSKPLPVSEGEELRQLREEVRVLRMERDFLKKAAAFFAKHQS